MKGNRKKSQKEKEKDLFYQGEDTSPKEVELQATKIFFENLNCKANIVANRGSAGSSKSFSLGQMLGYKFASEKNKAILILRKSLPSLRISTLWMMQDILGRFGIWDRVEFHKNQLNLTFNGNLIHFGSVDDPQKLKSSEWNYIWFEEATEFSQKDFETVRLYNRRKTYDEHPNQIFMSFNPIDEYHWIKTDLFREMDSKGNVYDNEGQWFIHEIHSTYKDNPFLPEDYVKQLENLEYQDYNYYRVYALGEWGRVGEVIYNNYSTVSEIPEGGETVYGLDFGFNAPSALIQCKIFKNGHSSFTVYEKQLIYKNKLTNSQLIQEMNRVIPEEDRGRAPIYADSAEPDRIKEIKNAGLGFVVKEATKNVKDGIDFVKRLDVKIHELSMDILKEKRGYLWKTKRAVQGNDLQVLDEPVGLNDHLMDAERYALYSHLKGANNIKVRWLP